MTQCCYKYRKTLPFLL